MLHSHLHGWEPLGCGRKEVKGGSDECCLFPASWWLVVPITELGRGEWAGMTVTDLSIAQPFVASSSEWGGCIPPLSGSDYEDRERERDKRNGKPLWGYLVGLTVAGLGKIWPRRWNSDPL